MQVLINCDYSRQRHTEQLLYQAAARCMGQAGRWGCARWQACASWPEAPRLVKAQAQAGQGGRWRVQQQLPSKAGQQHPPGYCGEAFVRAVEHVERTQCLQASAGRHSMQLRHPVLLVPRDRHAQAVQQQPGQPACTTAGQLHCAARAGLACRRSDS